MGGCLMTKKIVAIVVAVILVIGISAGTTLLVGKKDVPVATKVEDGLSAYELAVQFGYEGTVQEWLESLEGKSAYQIAVDSGYKGTESEWLASLKATSDNTANIKNAKFNSKGELILTLSDDTTINLGVAVGADGKDGAAGKNGVDGKDGKDGQNGTPGKDGVDGKDGVSISEASINGEGQLILTFTDGKSFNLDKVVGAKGEAGIGIANSKINEQGELVLTYSNGQEANLGKVLGAAGKDGQDGAPGKDGNAIISTVINNAGELVVTYSNGTSDNLGVVVGADGKDGADGQDGADGKDGINGTNGADGKDGKDGVNGTNGKDGVDGKDGVGVSSAQINSSGELVLTYSNGQISTLGKVIGADGKDGVNGTNGKDGKDGADGKDGKDGVDGTNGKDGKDGISIAKSEINSKGELVITYSNNEVENLGVIVGANGKDGVNGADGKDGVNGADGKDGDDGEDGKDGVGIEDIKIVNGNLSITLTNGTTMDLGNIKGADGKDGTNGTDGKDGTDGVDGKDGISVTGAEINAANELVLTFSDGTDKNLGVVVGADGKDGQNGTNGTDGVNGTDGRGIKKTEVNAIGELVITYTDDTTDNLGVIISDNGGAGTGAIAPRIQINASTNEWEISTDGGETYVSTGVKATGADGKDGSDGADGKDGANGISVIGANINGEKELVLTFSDGTEKNLGVVVGADGKDGADGQDGADGKDGINGTNGADGKDGEKGEDGTDGKDGVGISGAAIESNNHLVLTLSNGDTIDVGVVVGADGKNGVDGEDGKDGADGEDGKDGVGIKNVTVSEEGILTVTLDNDTIFTLGNIRGKDGIGIAKTEINAEGKLVITYTDNQVVTLDKVVGADGVGIKSAEITEDYMLKLVFTDNGTQEVGPIRGEKGADGVGIKNVSVGDDGYLYITYSNSDEAQKIAYIKGDKGDKGDAGADGKTPYIKNGTWWIGDSDTGIAATGEDGAEGKAGVGVANSYVDENLHLWIVLSDGTKIDAGYVGVTTGGGSTITKYTVVFKDYDGTVLKTEEVESGKSATAPANPTRNGFDFAGWDTDFSNITSSIVVTAKYTENTKPSIQVSNVTAKAGETVQVPVIIKNNPGIAGATLTFTYNSGLTLTSADSGEAFSTLTCSKPGKYTSPCKFTWDSESGETKENGTILYLSFTVPSTASVGDVYEISCSYRAGDIFNDAWDDVTLTTIGGGITVN